MEKSNYLILISASKDSAAMAQQLMQNILRDIDKNAKPLWFDSRGIGVFVSTDEVASEIWKLTRGEQTLVTGSFNDMLIVKIGDDWMGRKDAKPTHWLKTHVGSPKYNMKK